MKPLTHILIGLISATLITLFFNLSLLALLTIFLASFLIDIDHYLAYVYQTKKINPIKSIDYWYKKERKWRSLSKKQKKQYKITHFIFHGIEFYLLVGILAFFSEIFLWIFLGILIHIILDYIHIFRKNDLISIKLSQIYIYIKNKNKKRVL